jgi:hypothetical protein
VALVWLGIDPKKASATTAFIVVFASLSGFFGHAAMGLENAWESTRLKENAVSCGEARTNWYSSLKR